MPSKKHDKVESYSKTSYVLKNLAKYLKKHKISLIMIAFFTIVSNLIALQGPLLIGEAIKALSLEEGVNFNLLLTYSFYLVLIFIISGLLSYITQIMLVKVTQSMMCGIRKDLFDRIVHFPLKYFDKHQKGDLLARMSYDVDVLAESISNDVVTIVSSIVMVVGSFIMMIKISYQLVLIFVVIVPITFLFSYKTSKKSRQLFRTRQKNIGILNGYIEEMFTGFRTIKAYHQEEKTNEDFKQVNINAQDATFKAQYFSSMVMPTVNFFSNLFLTLAAVIGTVLMINGQLAINGIASFVLYSRKFSGPINEAMGLISDIQSALSAGERVFRTINEEVEMNDESLFKTTAKQGEVQLVNIDFGYEKNVPIIKNLSLDVKKGDLVAIVGPTGAGKTTIVNLLMRFYHLDGGKIILDGIDYDDLSLQAVRKSYAMVLQETWLFDGTIYDNIRYGNDNATYEDVVRVARLVRAEPFILKLENGYQTRIVENGSNLSQGERQLITIARAMLIDAKILILDEATSNVDTRSEVLVQEAMRELMKDKTSFVIAHRLSTVQNADLILVVDKGEIVEQGTHEDLLLEKGFYYRLYNAQFDND